MAWPRAGTMRCGCRAFEGQRPARPRASVPGPVSASCKLLPTLVSPNFPRVGDPNPISSPQPQLSPALPWDPWGSPKALVCPAATLATPRHLSFSDVSHDSAHVSWGHRKTCAPVQGQLRLRQGGHSGQVRAGLQVQGGDLFRDQPLASPTGPLNSGSVGVTASPEAQPQQCRGVETLTPPQPLWAPVLVQGGEAERVKQRIVRILTWDVLEGSRP